MVALGSKIGPATGSLGFQNEIYLKIFSRTAWLRCLIFGMCHFLFYAPNFGEVEGAYWFGPVRPSVRLSDRLSARNTWQLRNSRTAYARILKFYMWHVHEK